MGRREDLRRGPRADRRAASREPQLRLMVVCGAEKTEVDYFQGLRTLMKSAGIDLQMIEKSKSPVTVVEYARDHCNSADFDETWCVLDVDHFEREGGKISAAFTAASEAGIRLAVSNPCFELWLLLHHAETGASFDRCGQVEERLRKHVKKYDKTRLRFGDFSEGIEAAVKRARVLDPTGHQHKLNPSTSVWALVELITENR